MRMKLTVALAAFALAATPPAVLAQAKDKTAQSEKKAGKGGLAGQDLKYFNELAQANMAEVRAGKVAEEKAQSDDVKKYARHMIEDHGKMLEEQESMAQAKKVKMPAQPKKEDQAAVKKLQGLSGDKFDQAYMDQMLKDHEKALKLAKEASSKAKDAQLKEAAQKATPKIEEHLKMARQISGAAAGGTAAPKKK